MASERLGTKNKTKKKKGLYIWTSEVKTEVREKTGLFIMASKQISAH
jgi:hypothetical protein